MPVTPSAESPSSTVFSGTLPSGCLIQLLLSPEQVLHPHFIPPLFVPSSQGTPPLPQGQKYTIQVLNPANSLQAGILVYQFESSILISRQDSSLFIAIDENRYELKQRYLEIAISISVSIILVDEGILTLHAASMVLNDQGFLFVGASGSGKTTLAQIAHNQGLRVLNDELSSVWICPTNTYFVAPGPHWGSHFYTPHLGEHGQGMNSIAPLKALFFLEQKSHTGTTFSGIGQSDAAIRLIRSFFSARFVHQLPAEQKGQAFFALCQLARALPSQRLSIDLEDDVFGRLREQSLEPISKCAVTGDDFTSTDHLISTLSDNSLLLRLSDFALFKLDHHSAEQIKKDKHRLPT